MVEGSRCPTLGRHALPLRPPTPSRCSEGSAPPMNAHRVVVAGGGIAGLEAVLALHAEAGERFEITLLEPSIELVDRQMLVARPFAAGHAQRTPIARIIGATGA